MCADESLDWQSGAEQAMERRALFSPQRQLELVLAVASKTSEHLRREALIVNSHLQKIQRACRYVCVCVCVCVWVRTQRKEKKERKKKEKKKRGEEKDHISALTREKK